MAKGKEDLVRGYPVPKVPAEVAARVAGKAIDGIDASEAVADWFMACVSRSVDDRIIAYQKQGRAFFQISGAGCETLYLGLARNLRPAYDWFFPYYRDLALMLGLGVTPTEVLLQAVGSADDPSSGGRQMPSHWGHKALNVVSSSSPTGSQCLPAAGCAEATQYLRRHRDLPGTVVHDDEVTYVSLGEGATSEGEFWEMLNIASNLRLPLVCVIPDNGFAISVPRSVQHAAPISQLVQGFPNLNVVAIDGNDYLEVRKASADAIARARAGEGPALIHATVTRHYSHSAADMQSKYRLPAEIAADDANDPILRMRTQLIDAGIFTEADADALHTAAKAAVGEASRGALRGKRPEPKTVLDHVVAMPEMSVPDAPDPSLCGPPIAFGEAIRLTLHEVLASDERVRVFGEDVADARDEVLSQVEGKGGVFGTTLGLQRTFGSDRCFNTPIAEAMIIGRGVGQAVRGLRPAPEIQFFDYVWPAMTQIKSEAATLRWRSNGTFTCPMIIRIPIGGYLTGGAIWHSQSGESIFTHIPGLLVAYPSRARDAAGLLRYAFKCEDPVLFLEHKHLLRQPYTVDALPPSDWVLPFGVGDIRRAGSDLTIVTWGATVEKSLQAAEQLAEDEDADIEVIDLRTLAPWDRGIVADSVRRTNRLLVVQEDVLTSGFGAEVAAWSAQELFMDLDAPVMRVGALDTHVAYEPSLERAILPQVYDVVAAVKDLLAF
jgi:2-oxoisovalerate dehydrogenase E1 component